MSKSTLTIQGLIDLLSKVEDKSANVTFGVDYGCDMWGNVVGMCDQTKDEDVDNRSVVLECVYHNENNQESS